MNTLSRQLTAKFFPSPSDYHTLRLHWRTLVNSERKHELKAVHHLTYLILCGKDWRKAFTFPTNANKLNNGYTPALYSALRQLSSAYQVEYVIHPFDGLVTNETMVQARKYLSHVLASTSKGNGKGGYTCHAYSIPGQTDMENQEMNGQ